MPQAELTTRIKVLATIGVMLALLLAALDQTIVGTALPRIVAELNGLDRYSWLITGYLVASTVVVPIAGKLGDLFGRKPFLIAGMIGFVAASALCGVAQDMTQLIIFRIVQGLFGGMLFASAFTVLGDIYSPAERARIQGLFGAVFGLSSIIGPVVGGFLTDNLGWRWVFYVNLPVGLLGVLVTSALGIGTCVLGGWLADQYGPYRMFFLFTAISALISYPFFAYVLAAPGFGRLFLAQFVVLTVFGLLQGPGPGMLAGLFPVEVRSTGMAIAYNVGVTVFGGFAPLTVTWLIAATGSKLVPAYYIVAAAVLSIVVVGSTLSGVQRASRQLNRA